MKYGTQNSNNVAKCEQTEAKQPVVSIPVPRLTFSKNKSPTCPTKRHNHAQKLTCWIDQQYNRQYLYIKIYREM